MFQKSKTEGLRRNRESCNTRHTLLGPGSGGKRRDSRSLPLCLPRFYLQIEHVRGEFYRFVYRGFICK